MHQGFFFGSWKRMGKIPLSHVLLWPPSLIFPDEFPAGQWLLKEAHLRSQKSLASHFRIIVYLDRTRSQYVPQTFATSAQLNPLSKSKIVFARRATPWVSLGCRITA